MSGKQKSRAKHFTEEQIEKFRNDPNVRYVDDHTIRFKYEFRLKLYEAWEAEKRQGVRRTLIENGYDLKELGKQLSDSLCRNFKRAGRPQNAKSNQPVGSLQSFRTNPEDNEYLLKTGKFIKKNKGITFSDDFANELFHKYPEQSIEEGLKAAGIDPELVGYHRIYVLKRKFEGKGRTELDEKYSQEVIEKYKGHPYVESITVKQFSFSKAFYNEASSLIGSIDIDSVLEIYGVLPSDLSVSARTGLSFKLSHWNKTDDVCKEVSVPRLRIQQRRCQALTKLVEENFRRIRKEVSSMNCLQKKSLCLWIKDYPEDPQKTVSTSLLLKRTGISRSSYYSILRNDEYGTSLQRRNEQDDKDIEVIRQVIEYRGYRKGIRQIYMMMDTVASTHFSIKKIRRLMKKYDVHSGLREKKQSRIENRRNLEAHKKPNLLKRKFRLAGPNEHILTDVTYIPYGDNKIAYGSAAIDAVTGKIYDLTVSDCNDLVLVSSTVSALKETEFRPDAIFHSDQGALYLTDAFQKQIAELGLRQSMSKRGNCWDNAPQESFFGHFKDECDYRSCAELSELQARCTDYKDYFNTERPQWNRNRMTPEKYEKYLDSLDQKEFAEYLRKEEGKYELMKKRAADRAIQRSETLGV